MSEYILSIFVPEVAVMLIKEDLTVNDDAQRILQESATLGERVHGV